MAAPKKTFEPNLKITSAWGAAMLGIIALIIILIVVGVPSDLRAEEGFLGTDSASLMADLTVLAYVLLLVPLMIVGFLFARRKQFVPHHQVIMTSIVLFNWGLISFIMAVSYNNISGDVPDNIDDKFYFLPTIHLLFGLAAQLVGSYLVIRMWFEDELPAGLKVKQIKPLMRFTLACWLIAVALGIITYLTWNRVIFEDEAETTPPVSTPVATEEPAAAPTEAATPEAVPAATEEAQPEATEEMTEEATEEAED